MDNRVYLDDNIWFIENFISHEDLDVLLSECNDCDGWGGLGNWLDKVKEPKEQKTKDVINSLNIRIQNEITNDIEMANAFNALQRTFPSSNPNDVWSLEPHTDTHEYSDSQYVTKGYILYFNDTFSGGELEYVNKNLSIKPKPGMLVCHPGSEEYKHGVRAVTDGVRFYSSSFVYDKKYMMDIRTKQ